MADIRLESQTLNPTQKKTSRGFEFTIALENPERLEEIYNLDKDFERQAKGLFLETVFQIHKYLIQISPMDTGELRGGWTALLLKYNKDFSVQLRDESLYNVWKESNKTEYGKNYHFDPKEFQKGVSQSFLEELPLDISIINTVPQAYYLEFGTSKIPARHTVELARYKGEYTLVKNFEEWFEDIAKNEKIVNYASQTHKVIPQ